MSKTTLRYVAVGLVAVVPLMAASAPDVERPKVGETVEVLVLYASPTAALATGKSGMVWGDF